jgi:hypothetical protein
MKRRNCQERGPEKIREECYFENNSLEAMTGIEEALEDSR